MELEDQFRYLVGGYYGVALMDEYPLKEFILKDSSEHTTIERINVYIDGALVPQSAYTFDNPNICFLNPPGKGYTIIIQYFN